MIASLRPALVDYDDRRLDELVHLWRASFEAGVGVINAHPYAEQRDYFVAEVLPRYDVRLAILGDELVGFIAASAESVSQLYVHVYLRRRGVGRRLLAWAKERSGGRLWLYTYARNLGARAFYERNGFVAIAHGFEAMWRLEDIKYQWFAGQQNSA